MASQALTNYALPANIWFTLQGWVYSAGGVLIPRNDYDWGVIVTTYGMGPAMEQIGINAEYGFRWAASKLSVAFGGSGVVSAAAGGLDDVGRAGYRSFGSFKKAAGSAGKNNAWHHIVEQSQIGKTGFSPTQIHNSKNIIAVDSAVHAKISGFYNSYVRGTKLRVRDWLAGQSFEAQYQYGLDVLRRFNVIK